VSPVRVRAQLTVTRSQAGQRLDKLVGCLLGAELSSGATARPLGSQPGSAHDAGERAVLGRAALQELFSNGSVWVTGADGRHRRASKGESAVEGERIVVCPDPEHWPAGEPIRALPDPEAVLRVVLETEALVVVDKPARQPCAPLEPRERGTVANALLARYPEMAKVGFSPREPGLCHRLDNDTSGLLLAARSAAAFATLTAELKAGRLHKRYLLVCKALGLPERGVIDAPLAPHPRDARRVLCCVDSRDRARLDPRPALTRFRVLRRAGDLALVEARVPHAGRHQIRALFAAIGHPIHGDRLYGSKTGLELGRHALHASLLAFRGAEGIAPFRVRSPLPVELRALLGPWREPSQGPLDTLPVG